MTDTHDDSITPAPIDALPIVLAAAAIEYAAKNASSWAAPSDQDTAAALFSKLSELLQIELLDPSRSTSVATLEAVTRVSEAYAVAAKTLRRADVAPELGDGELKQQGITYAADWLQNRADELALIVTELGERLPQMGHRPLVRFDPTAAGGRPAVEFATLVVVHNGQINATIHLDEAAANEHYHKLFHTDESIHRIDSHTVNVVDDLGEDWLHNDPTTEFVTLVVVQGGQINVSVHVNEFDANAVRRERFTGVDLYRVDSHWVGICAEAWDGPRPDDQSD